MTGYFEQELQRVEDRRIIIDDRHGTSMIIHRAPTYPNPPKEHAPHPSALSQVKQSEAGLGSPSKGPSRMRDSQAKDGATAARSFGSKLASVGLDDGAAD